MSRISCEVTRTMLTNERGQEVPGVEVMCLHCEHTVESFGTTGASVRRCLALLREQCPEEMENFYVADDEGD
jgi:hypothetical protein